jgi:hypothetical protein
MKFREFLQIEIWSKETTRKIHARVGKVFGRVAIDLGVLAVLLCTIYSVETYWLTTDERKAATAALANVDSLQDFVTADGVEFEARDRKAIEYVEAAKRATWTLRDKRVATRLSLYLEITESDRRDAVMEEQVRAVEQARGVPFHSGPVSDEKWASLKTQIRFLLRSLVLESLK